MRIFKTRLFTKWAHKAGLDDHSLRAAADEIRAGAFEADLGGGAIKKRLALPGRGKSGGARTIVAYRRGKHVFLDSPKMNVTTSTGKNWKPSGFWPTTCSGSRPSKLRWHAGPAKYSR